MDDCYAAPHLALAFFLGAWLTFGAFLVLEQVVRWMGDQP